MIHHPLTLETARVRLEPIDRRHIPDLIAHCNDEALWKLTFGDNPFTNAADTERWFGDATDRSRYYGFAIIDKTTGRAIGSTRYFDLQPEHKKLEIGWTFIARSHWRTHVNTECKYLLLSHAFDTLDLNRVQLKGEAINTRSRAAMEGIGATYEGTLRSFRVHPASGERRDTSFYSIVREDWPAIKARLEARIRDNPSSVSR